MRPRRHSVQHLDELQLVVQIVLEPEHQFVLFARGFERGVATLEVGQHARVLVPAAIRDEARPDFPQPTRVGAARHGPVVQHVAPRKQAARDAGVRNDVDGGVTVGDMKHG